MTKQNGRQQRNQALMPPAPKTKGAGAVMNQRAKRVPDGLDDFPTPPWAMRALIKHVLPLLEISIEGASVWEPAANRGILVEVLREYRCDVFASDIFDYGFPLDALGSFGEAEGQGDLGLDAVAWPHPHQPRFVITNPPFNLALEFTLRAIREATGAVAMLCRSNWAEGLERYERLFKPHPPIAVAQFVERVPMIEGGSYQVEFERDGEVVKERLPAYRGGYDPDASTATSYAWFIWPGKASGKRLVRNEPPAMLWIPPCREALTRPDDAARFGKIKEAPLA